MFRQRSTKFVGTPNGFDITLAQVIGEYDFDMGDIQRLGELTANGEIPNAKLGHQVYYRRSSIESIFNRKPVGVAGGK